MKVLFFQQKKLLFPGELEPWAEESVFTRQIRFFRSKVLLHSFSGPRAASLSTNGFPFPTSPCHSCSDPQSYPKRKGSIPRSSVSVVQLKQIRGNRRLLGTVIGAAAGGVSGWLVAEGVFHVSGEGLNPSKAPVVVGAAVFDWWACLTSRVQPTAEKRGG